MIRPDLIALLRRWSEVIVSAMLAALGLWLIRLGGLILIPIGAGLLALAAPMALLAYRRIRFAQPSIAIGMVEVDEAQIGYYRPDGGGFVSLQDLIELRLIRISGAPMWRLKQSDGQTLLIPTDAAGAERLFDAFAALPGMDTAALVAALSASAPDLAPIWRRPGKAPAE